DERDVAVLERPGEVLAPSADEVVEHDHLVSTGEHELVGDVRPDRAAAAGDEGLADRGHERASAAVVRSVVIMRMLQYVRTWSRRINAAGAAELARALGVEARRTPARSV